MWLKILVKKSDLYQQFRIHHCEKQVDSEWQCKKPERLQKNIVLGSPGEVTTHGGYRVTCHLQRNHHVRALRHRKDHRHHLQHGPAQTNRPGISEEGDQGET